MAQENRGEAIGEFNDLDYMHRVTAYIKRNRTQEPTQESRRATDATR